MKNIQTDSRILYQRTFRWNCYEIWALLALSFFFAIHVCAIEHITYPAFYPNIPSSAGGDVTYIYQWGAQGGGTIYPGVANFGYSGVDESLGANTTEDIQVNGTNLVRGFYESYSDTYTFSDCPFSLALESHSRCAQWGSGTNGLNPPFNLSPTNPTIYCYTIPSDGQDNCCGSWYPFGDTACGTITKHFQGTNLLGQVIWTVDYTYQTNVNACFFYEYGGLLSCNTEPLPALTLTVEGGHPFTEIDAWVQQGATPPSLASLGVNIFVPGYVILTGVGGGGSSYSPTPPPPAGFPTQAVFVRSPNGPLGLAIAAGYCHALALKTDGSVWAWGDNTYDQLGNPSVVGQTANPTPVTGIPAMTSLAAGRYHSMALANNGTVWAWGNNQYGQVYEHAPLTVVSNPVQVLQGNNLPLTNIISIAAGPGGFTSYAVQANGTVWAWGYNYYGEVGDGSMSSQINPTPTLATNLTGVVTVAAGTYHALALTTNGLVYTWGCNSLGQLGNGSSGPNSATPTLVTNLTNTVIVAIAACNSSSFALDNNGNVWEWGQVIGATPTASNTVPVLVSGLNPTNAIIGISGGYLQCLAVAADGTFWAWGDGTWGDLGNGTATPSVTPVRVSFPDGSQSIGISGGLRFSLSIQSDGTLRSWGSNWGIVNSYKFCGQLGRTTTSSYSTIPGTVNPF